MAIVERLPARLRAPFQQFRSLLDTSLWVWPSLGALAALIVAAAAVQAGPVDIPYTDALADPEAARATLTTIVAATTAAMSLLFTGTVVALQLATGQYSPRLLRDVLLDPRLRSALAVLVGTVAYGLSVIPQLAGDTQPTVAVLIAVVLGLTVLVAFIVFLDRIVDLLRLETIIEGISDRTLRAIEMTHPRDHEPVEVELPDHASSVESRRSGYVQAVSLDVLLDAAVTADVNLVLRPAVGDFLVTDTAVAWVWRDEDDEPPDDETMSRLADEIDDALALGTDRTVHGDPAYGIRHLVDIGLRGVSPGVNDPTTAQQAINLMTRALVALARRPLADRVAERDGVVAVVRQPDLAAYVELAQSQLLSYGGGDARVVESLVHQLRDLLQGGTTPTRIDIVETHLDRIGRDDRHPARPAHERIIIDSAVETVRDLLAGRASDDEDTAG